MTKLDDILVPQVIKILKDFGVSAQIKRVTPGTYDAETGSYEAGVETGSQTWSVKAIPPGSYVKYWSNGEPVVSSQLQSGIQGGSLSFTPQLGDFLLIGSDRWIIDKLEPIYSGESICLWVFTLRR